MSATKTGSSIGVSCKKSITMIDTMRANSLGLTTILVLTLAALSATSASAPEGSIERPASRAAPTGFVPRLGKRLDHSQQQQQQQQLERVLCANSPDCSRLALLGAMVKGMASVPALATAPGLFDDSTFYKQQQQQSADDNLSAFNLGTDDRQVVVGTATSGYYREPSLFDMLAAFDAHQARQQQQGLPPRVTRASDGSASSEQLIGGGDDDTGSSSSLSVSNFGGTKRVAFTPRIGRRRR